MPALSSLTRKLSTAFTLFQEDGIHGVISALQERADLRSKLSAAQATDSVNLDGCMFNLKQLPDTPMKLALFEKKYEDFERQAVFQYVDTDQPVIELGGCIGVVACVTNRMLKNPSSHVVVEANPNVLPFLEENRNHNQCQFEILNTAIAYDNDFVTFSPARDFWGNSLRGKNSGPTVTVNTMRLRDIVDQRGFDSFTLICDIEGHEYDLVFHEPDVLEKATLLILETHERLIGEEKNTQLLNKLNDLGFRAISQESAVIVMKRTHVA